MTTTAVASPPPPTGAVADRLSRCRYLVRRPRTGLLERCTAEAVEPGSDIDLCTEHLADAMRLLIRHGINTRRN